MHKADIDDPVSFLGMNRHRAAAIMSQVDPDMDIDDEDAGTYLTSQSRGMSMLAFAGVVTTIFLYAEGQDDCGQYRGAIPGDAAFDMGRDEHRSRLGDPVSFRDAVDDLPSWDVYEMDGVRLHVEYRQDADTVALYVVTHVPRMAEADDPVSVLGMSENEAGDMLYRGHRDLVAYGDAAENYLQAPGSNMSLWCVEGGVVDVHLVRAGTDADHPVTAPPGGVEFGMDREEHRKILGRPTDSGERRVVGHVHARSHQCPGEVPAYDMFRLKTADMYVEYDKIEQKPSLYILSRTSGRPGDMMTVSGRDGSADLSTRPESIHDDTE